MNLNKKELFQAIGYTFSDIKLLNSALTRVAYAGEHGIEKKRTMDRFAVLGDAALDTAVIEYLLALGEDDKGDITMKKIALVNMSVFRRFAESINLPDFVFWGAGELRQRIWESGRVSAECFEALCGAAYLDGGMDAVKIILKTVGRIGE